MNGLQRSLLKIIIDLSKFEEIDKYGDDLLYGFRNYVRRFSLAENNYYITQNATKVIKDHDPAKPFIRCWKNQNGKKYRVKYDHAVPAKEIVKLILKNKNDKKEIKNILLKTNHIVILTPEENNKLAKKFRASMPDGWNHRRDNVFARYQALRIQIENNKMIRMAGALTV